jgi:hemoglobin
MIPLMRSVYEAAGGDEGLLRLAEAWHARVLADEAVSHAFSHGFHPQHSERLAAYWAEAPGSHRAQPRRPTANEALVAAARAWGLDSELLDPHRALKSLQPRDVALARLEVH